VPTSTKVPSGHRLTNPAVTFELRIGSPTSSTTSGSNHSEDLIARYDKLRNYDGAVVSSTNEAAKDRNHTLSSMNRIYYPSSSPAGNPHLDTTNNSILTEEHGSHNSTQNQSIMTNTSGIWPDDPRGYAPSALSALWPPKGHNDSAVSLNTEKANAIALSRSRKQANLTKAMSNASPDDTERPFDKSSAYLADHSESTKFGESSKEHRLELSYIPKSNDMQSTQKHVRKNPPPPPYDDILLNGLTQSASVTKQSRPKPALTFSPFNSTLSRAINHEETLPKSQITQNEVPSNISAESTFRHVEVSEYQSDENDDTSTNADVTVILHRAVKNNIHTQNPPQRRYQLNPLAHSTAIQADKEPMVHFNTLPTPAAPTKRSSQIVFNPALEEELYFIDLGNGNYQYLIPDERPTEIQTELAHSTKGAGISNLTASTVSQPVVSVTYSQPSTCEVIMSTCVSAPLTAVSSDTNERIKSFTTNVINSPIVHTTAQRPPATYVKDLILDPPPTTDRFNSSVVVTTTQTCP
jgi:hypothetical protein